VSCYVLFPTFEGSQCFHLQSKAVKKKALRSFETSRTIQPNLQSPDDSNLQQERRKNLKFRLLVGTENVTTYSDAQAITGSTRGTIEISFKIDGL
jgi:hypothetical protein